MTLTRITGRFCFYLGCAALTAASACSSGSDYDTETNPQAASLAVSQLAGISGGIQASSPDAAASGVFELGSVAQNIIVPVTNQGQTSARVTAPGPYDLTGTCTCDASGCVFDSCSDDAAGFTIDGSIAVDGDHYTFDVTIDQTYASDSDTTTSHLSTSGDITIGATSIDGSVSGDGNTAINLTDSDGQQQTITASYNWDLDANQIALDQSRCAVGGSLHACVSARAAANGQSAKYNGCGTVDFGPACGDAVAE